MTFFHPLSGLNSNKDWSWALEFGRYNDDLLFGITMTYYGENNAT